VQRALNPRIFFSSVFFFVLAKQSEHAFVFEAYLAVAQQQQPQKAAWLVSPLTNAVIPLLSLREQLAKELLELINAVTLREA
jgi:hypothetical protein